MVEDEQACGISEVDGVDMNNFNVKKLIYVKSFFGESQKSVDVLIDNGSSCNVMNKALCKRLDIVFNPAATSCVVPTD